MEGTASFKFLFSIVQLFVFQDLAPVQKGSLNRSGFATGYVALDELLNSKPNGEYCTAGSGTGMNALMPGCVMEIVGDVGAGKTSVALAVALSQCYLSVRAGRCGRVLFIDTGNSVHTHNMAAISSNFRKVEVTAGNDAEAVNQVEKSALEKLHIQRIYDIHGILDILAASLHSSTPSNDDEMTSSDCGYELVVIDCMYNVLAPLSYLSCSGKRIKQSDSSSASTLKDFKEEGAKSSGENYSHHIGQTSSVNGLLSQLSLLLKAYASQGIAVLFTNTSAPMSSHVSSLKRSTNADQQVAFDEGPYVTAVRKQCKRYCTSSVNQRGSGLGFAQSASRLQQHESSNSGGPSNFPELVDYSVLLNRSKHAAVSDAMTEVIMLQHPLSKLQPFVGCIKLR